MENEKLSRFIAAVNSETDKQVMDILDDAEREKERILAAAVSTAEEAKQRNLRDTLKMTDNKYVRMVSKTELAIKKEVLLCREELTKELFDRVIARIKEFTETTEYEKLIFAKLEEENDLNTAKVCLAPAHMHMAESIKKAFGCIDVTADESIKYGGFFILRPEKGTVTDRTFDSALEEQHSMFASRNLLSALEGQN